MCELDSNYSIVVCSLEMGVLSYLNVLSDFAPASTPCHGWGQDSIQDNIEVTTLPNDAGYIVQYFSGFVKFFLDFCTIQRGWAQC